MSDTAPNTPEEQQAFIERLRAENPEIKESVRREAEAYVRSEEFARRHPGVVCVFSEGGDLEMSKGKVMFHLPLQTSEEIRLLHGIGPGAWIEDIIAPLEQEYADCMLSGDDDHHDHTVGSVTT